MQYNLLLNLGEMFTNLWSKMGIANIEWRSVVMLLISFVLMYLAIVKKYEPLLLLPIAFGMFLINLPGAYEVVWGKYPDPVEIVDSTQLSQYLSTEQYESLIFRYVMMNGNMCSWFQSIEKTMAFVI